MYYILHDVIKIAKEGENIKKFEDIPTHRKMKVITKVCTFWLFFYFEANFLTLELLAINIYLYRF